MAWPRAISFAHRQACHFFNVDKDEDEQRWTVGADIYETIDELESI
jgi:hypothetical protein